jgi:hypothetical protein
MSYQVDLIIMHGKDTQTEIDGKWVACRPKRLPVIDSFFTRLDDVWLVLTGKADAITWYKQ